VAHTTSDHFSYIQWMSQFVVLSLLDVQDVVKIVSSIPQMQLPLVLQCSPLPTSPVPVGPKSSLVGMVNLYIKL